MKIAVRPLLTHAQTHTQIPFFEQKETLYVRDDGLALVPVDDQRLPQILWMGVKDLLDFCDRRGLDGGLGIEDQLGACGDGAVAEIVDDVGNLLVGGCFGLCLDEIDFEVVVDGGLFEESEGFDGDFGGWVVEDGEHGESWKAERHCVCVCVCV